MNKKLLLFCLVVACSILLSTAQETRSFPTENAGKIMLGTKNSVFSDRTISLIDKATENTRTIARVGATGSTIYGYQSYADVDGFIGGMYEIEPSGDMKGLWTYSFAEIGASVNNGWLRNGRLCGLGIFTVGSEDLVGDYAYQEFDFTTGEMLVSRRIETQGNFLPYFYKAAYVPEEDRIYGFGRIGDITQDNRFVFKSAPADRPEDAVMITEVSPGDRCYSLCWHPVDKCFYGINTWGKLIKIERDGTYAEICDMSFGNLANSSGALTYSPYDGYLLWNPVVHEAKSRLYAIYPEERRVEELVTFDVDRQFTFFMTTDFNVDNNAPSSAIFIGSNFIDGAHDGSLSYRLPEKTLGGEPLSGELSYILYADGNKIGSGKADAGSRITIAVKNLTDSYYTFRLEAEKDGKNGVPCVSHIYVGNDIPSTPANVIIADGMISWDEVKGGIHQGYLDTSVLEYHVYLNGKQLGSTKSTSLPLSLDPQQDLDSFRARVIAVCNGMSSKEGVSEKVILGNPLSLPVQILPTEHQADLCTYVNRDGSPEYGTWSLSDSWGDLCFSSGWSYEQPDDWLILPVTMFPDADKVYSVSIEAARGGLTGTHEYFEIWAGNAPDPEAMTIPVIEKTRARKYNEWVDYSGIFTIPESGTYYIAVHGVSDPDQKSLIVKNIRVAETEYSVKSPDAVSSLDVISSSDADLTATISLTLPLKYISGKNIEEGVKVKVTATGAGSITAQGNPGETITMTVPTAQGDNYINVTTEVDGAKGRSKEVVVFTGMDMLSYIENLTSEISEDNMSVKLKWSAPKESLNGGYFSTTGIRYNIGNVDTSGAFLEEPIRTEPDVTEYTIVYPEGTPQKLNRIGVVAENAAGVSHAVYYITEITGTPYSLPILDEFDDLQVKYNPLSVSKPTKEYGTGAWSFGQPELVNPVFAGSSSKYAIVGYTDEAPAKVRMRLPKVSTEALTEAYATFELWTGENCADPIEIYAITHGMKQPEKIASLSIGNGWKFITVAIPEKYLNRKWMNLYIDGKLKSSEHFLIMSSYSIDKNSGISDIAEVTGSIEPGSGTIRISGFEGENYTIVRLAGIVAASGNCEGDVSVNVNPGIYIVKAGTHTVRVIVK